MFRLWAKEFKSNRMLRDTTICDDSAETRTHKVFHALDEVCYEFDLSKPIWLAAASMIFAVFVGMAAGYFPALRAMRLSPLAAIHNE